MSETRTTPLGALKRFCSAHVYDETMFDADRFWPKGDADARDWNSDVADIREWQKGCRQSYERHPNEYTPPTNTRLLVSHEVARNSSLEEPESYVGRSHFWSAVRGTDYAPAARWDIPTGQARAIVVELVPTPENPHDPCVIAVEHEGKKLGNLSRGYARYAHWKIRQLNRLGYRTTTAAVYRAFYRPEIDASTSEAFVALPTFGSLDGHLPSIEVQIEEFRDLWDALDEETRDAIRGQGYHLDDATTATTATTATVLHYGARFPHLTLPVQPYTGPLPHPLDLALRAVRQDETAARRFTRDAAQEALWARDRNAVANLIDTGLHHQLIADRLGISKYRVARAVKELRSNDPGVFARVMSLFSEPHR